MFEALEAGDPRRVGRYRVVARLGAGGMGRVYLGRSPGGRAVAVKVVRPELAEDAEFRRRFAREVAAARRVNGAFTAGVVDADPEGSPAWLATVYVPGLSLGEAVAAHGPWRLEPVLALGAGLAEGLEVIHAAGVVHRDLKPSNVLLAADGPRVIDFGISLAGEASVLTRTGVMPGTPGFMSPEQLTARPVGPACDVFALGAVLTFTATGVGPFGTGSGHVLNFRTVYEEPDLAALPAPLRAVVARCLVKDPGERPGPAELLDQLAESARGGRATPVVLTEAEWMPEAVARTVRLRTTAPSPEPPPSPTSARTPDPQSAAPPATDPVPPRPTIAEQDRTDAHPRNTSPATTPVIGTTEPVPRAYAHSPRRVPQPSTVAAAGPTGVSRRRALLGLAGTVTAGGLGVAGWYFVKGGSRKPKWTFTKGGSNYATPLVSGGVVYVSGREASLYAVDAATGRQRWKFGTVEDAEEPSSLAMSGGLVYVCGGKRLYAVDMATGKQRWNFPTSGDAYAPAATDGLVYVSGDAYLYAVDAADGKQRWKFRTDATAFRASPAVADGVVYVGEIDDGLLYALDAVTGEQRWKSHVGIVSWAPPVLADGVVYCTTSGGRLFAVDAANGKPKWEFSNGGGGSVAVSGGLVYVCGGKQLHALDVATGGQRWIFPVGSSLSSPAVSDGVVYVATASDDKYLYAVDAASGEQRWRFPTHDAASTPVVVNGLVYVSTFERLYAVPV
ncbi:PQQ-binding-like beta-propeller repeat protein [Streptomyces sp. BPTC-684]|uniref:outer membrane protein assembly factor BamB family protein n=1 Tax=Streptomyces sp. BPTC-684 TaxID=3043734 RepID=UPI0024B17725|nr:PQQ-binding-like beta-propeller repeat protein [Streptomyces sp. BPTC-684]WHM40720.1 PQQ-binding-like beta-propeller repeat protein [Streptomyces sp. BPTC-684]